MAVLRPYQVDLKDRTRAKIREGARRIIIQMPTGAGKTLVATSIIADATAKGSRSLFVAHRKELIEQCSRKLTDAGIDHGIIMAKHWRSRPHLPVQIASIQTLAHRALPEADLIVIDESHRAMSPSYRALIDAYPQTVVLGLTATPTRIDGKGLGAIYDAIISGPSIKDMTRDGYLVPIRHFAPFTPDLKTVHTVGGDYDEGELAEIMDKPKLTGDIIAHWKKIAQGRPTIVFTTTVDHSKHVTEGFRQAGINAVHVDGKTPARQRDQAFTFLASGRIDVLCNCGIAIEGVDIPVVSCVVLARPTKSLVVYLQSVGRGMRPADGKTDLIVLDHASCAITHGLVGEDRIWTLESATKRAKKKEREISVTTCPQCFAAYSSTIRKCPNCGFMPAAKERQIESVDGSLIEIDEIAFQRQRRIEVARARSLEDLKKIEIARGYKPGWAHIRWNMRNKRQA